MEFKIGDKVKIIRNLENNISWGSRYITKGDPATNMDSTFNCIGTLSNIRKNVIEVKFKNNAKWTYNSESLQLIVIPYRKIIKKIIEGKI